MAIVDWKEPRFSAYDKNTPETQMAWIFICLRAMQSPHLKSYGSSDDPNWWAHGYEHERRMNLDMLYDT